MKKLLLLLLIITMVLPVVIGSAEVLPAVMNRNVGVVPSVGNNTVIPGESPTTGLPKADPNYAPFMVQIDNNFSALPQWGIGSADIMYEAPIQGQGWTRFTALFSDQYPAEAGPVRSGRVLHADLREEWDAAFLFYGKQEAAGSDLREALRNYGVNTKQLAIDGIGNKYQDYFARVKYHRAPHNVSVFVDKMFNEVVKPLNYQFPVRPFLFTDELPTLGVVANRVNIIHKGNVDTSSSYAYDAASNTYTRYTEKGVYDDLLVPGVPIQYSNIIVQRTRLTFNNSSLNPLLPDVVGQGAAEIFMGGRYIPGAWTRGSLQSRTVFYDSEGNEIKLQRGKTWIVLTDEKTQISIDGEIGDIAEFFKEAKKNARLNPPEKEEIDKIADANQGSAGAVVILGPKMNVDFEFAKAPKNAVIQYYTPIKMEGFEPTIYAFTDQQGNTQFRVYGRVVGKTRGFYSLSVTKSDGSDTTKPYDFKITSDNNVKDAKVFALYKGAEADVATLPQGFNKGSGTGIYTFINLFGKPENLAYASADGTNYGWYFVNVRRPLAGSLEVDMDAVNERMTGSDGVVYQLPPELKAGYARAVKVNLADGEQVVVYTDYPMIKKDFLTAK